MECSNSGKKINVNKGGEKKQPAAKERDSWVHLICFFLGFTWSELLDCSFGFEAYGTKVGYPFAPSTTSFGICIPTPSTSLKFLYDRTNFNFDRFQREFRLF